MTTLGLSARAGLLEPSPTLAMTAKARRMRAEGTDVISFAAGEPDFNTPAPICEAAERAIRDGQTKYTATAGIPALREAISRKLARENQLDYSPDRIVVTCGAKHAVYAALQVLVDPGDEVLLVAPFWMTYVDQVRLAGGVPVIVQTSSDTGFSPTVEQIAQAVSPRTKAIVLNSPCNPTGAMIDPETLAGIGELALRHRFWIVSDEIYERLTYGHAHRSAAALGAEVAAQTVTIGGVSKTYAMTGWRIGYAAAPAHVVSALCNFQDQVTSNASSIAQAAAAAAYDMPSDLVTTMRDEFRARRDLMVGLLREIPGLSCDTPEGAFYVFPDVSPFLARFGGDAALAEHLLEHAHVATMPGSVFHGPGHLRLSYAASRPDIERGVARIGEALAQATR